MHTTQKTLLALLLLCLYVNVSYSSAITTAITKGFHVNNFKKILGHEDEETKLLEFAAEHGFNYLLLYNLNFINNHLFDLTDPEQSIVLATFIEKAKTQYGIQEIGMVGEKAASFAWVPDYQEDYEYRAEHRIDVYHLEFEFWNQNLIDHYYCNTYLEEAGLDCTTDGAFEFYQQELSQIKAMTESHNLRCETYIGNTTVEQCAWIGQSCDRVLVHYYRKSDVYKNGNSIYQYKAYRLAALAPPSGTLSVLPIFSAGSRFMGPWLSENPKEKAFVTYLYGQEGHEEQEGDWKNRIVIEGYQWYRYSDLQIYIGNSLDFMSPEVYSELESKQPSSPSLEVYPNPANQWLSIATRSKAINRVEVYQMNGMLLHSFEEEALNALPIDVSTWPEGRLIIRYFENEVPQFRSLLIQHE